MSTEHTGAYCPVKDKMVLSREEAAGIAKRTGNATYKCEHCDGWHITSGRRMRLPPRGGKVKARKFRP